jgi:uncharacterized membrane protein
MRRIVRYLVQGLMVLAPLGVTAYLAAAAVVALDEKVNAVLSPIAGRSVPGVGVPIVLAAVLVAGFLVDLWFFRRLWRLMDATLEKVPVLKSVYGGVRDTLQFLFGEKRSFSRVVLVELPGCPHAVLGMVTNEDPGRDLRADLKGKIGVYVPMAFNLGGYTLFVDADKTLPVGMPADDAMAFILTGGIPRRKEGEGERKKADG